MPPLIELENVRVMRGERLVLHDLSFKIERGEHAAILGPNGCGKSTLIKTLMREVYPLARDGSAIRFLGEELWNVFEMRSHLGIVVGDFTDSARVFTAEEIVLSSFFGAVGIWPHHEVTDEMRERTKEVLALLDAGHLSDRLYGELSSGEQRRILIARALVHSPEALLLDEPTTSLDLSAQHELRETMRRLADAGIAILLVTHHLSDIIPEIDRIIMMKGGRIVADGGRRELLAQAAIEQLFGTPVDLSERNGYVHAW